MGRLVITQKGRDVRRVAASLSAYLLIAVAAVCALWLGLSVVVVVAQTWGA